jgi:hypothetical protein
MLYPVKISAANIPFLTKALTKAQARQLRSWLVTEGCTYMVAASRLQERFGICASTHQLSKFYIRECAPRPAFPSLRGRPVVFDLRVTRNRKGWRFLLLERAPNLRATFAGRKLRPGIPLQTKS